MVGRTSDYQTVPKIVTVSLPGADVTVLLEDLDCLKYVNHNRSPLSHQAVSIPLHHLARRRGQGSKGEGGYEE